MQYTPEIPFWLEDMDGLARQVRELKAENARQRQLLVEGAAMLDHAADEIGETILFASDGSCRDMAAKIREALK